MSGLSLTCCSKPQKPGSADLSYLILVNAWLALLQLITTVFLLVGWVWSLVWGVAFIRIGARKATKLANQILITLLHLKCISTATPGPPPTADATVLRRRLSQIVCVVVSLHALDR